MVIILDCWHFKKKNGYALLVVCNLCMGLLDKNGSEACSVMVWVLGLASLLKLSIMACQSSELCVYPTYGLS
jgi:hypothetical protein